MTITPEFMERACRVIRATLLELRPQLLESSGRIEHTIKADTSVVTTMDALVENRLHDTLAELEPSIGFAGEETGADYDQPTFWLVDPIDGTEAFIRGLPFATNMIALIHEDEPILSIIYNFTLDEFYYATKGGGATMNGHPIHVSNRKLNRAYVIFASTIKNPKLEGAPTQLKHLVKGLLNTSSSGYEFSAIASGGLDGKITYDTAGHEWDFAPGSLLVTEAGGRVQNIGSKKYNYRDVHLVASNPVIFDDLQDFIEGAIRGAEKA